MHVYVTLSLTTYIFFEVMAAVGSSVIIVQLLIVPLPTPSAHPARHSAQHSAVRPKLINTLYQT